MSYDEYTAWSLQVDHTTKLLDEAATLRRGRLAQRGVGHRSARRTRRIRRSGHGAEVPSR